MRYLYEVLKHKWFVFYAGIWVGGISWWRLLVHDCSKFSLIEFRAYRRRFVLNNCSENEWKVAWLHHIHRNPHHWQHWILKDESLPMPEVYVREMVADWFGAGRSYEGNWDIHEWLNKNYPHMVFHADTILILKKVLAPLGLDVPPHNT